MGSTPDGRAWTGLGSALIAGVALITFACLHNSDALLHWIGVTGAHGRSAVFAVIFGMSALLLLFASAIMLGIHGGMPGDTAAVVAFRSIRNLLLVLVGALCGWAIALLYTPFGAEDAARLHSISQALTVFASGYLLSKLDRLLERALFGADGTPSRGWIYALLFSGALLATLLMTFSARQYGAGDADDGARTSFTASPGTIVRAGRQKVEVGADGRLRIGRIDYGPVAPWARVTLGDPADAVLIDGVVRASVAGGAAPVTPPAPAEPRPRPAGR